jgi:hypothetical protein
MPYVQIIDHRVGVGYRLVDQWRTPFMGRVTASSLASTLSPCSVDRFSAIEPLGSLACVDGCVWGGRRDARIKDI